ncbi:MAG: hypothetical protein K2N84_04815, partial [Clostridia bacterium]|nr:hypothetical protein [Clostridia bacterium]
MKDIASKKYAKIASAAIGTALLSCFAVLGVACGGNPEQKPDEKPEDKNPTAILTFVEGIDDNTTSFTYTSKVGATLGSVLENVEPTAIDALKFGGWF